MDYSTLTQDELRSLIAEEMKKEKIDWRAVEAASRAIVDNDPNSVRFSVDAAHIQRLGEQLVSKQETALSELIKNSYDADATTVTLDFYNHSQPGGTLIIRDNGIGMAEDVVRSSWMTISTNNKETEPKSPVFGRIRAGRKGIGRFSVQRLGKTLKFTTKPAGSDTGLRVFFDWDASFRSGVALNDVFSTIERFQKKPEEQGTELEIGDLRDKWTTDQIDKVWRAVILLQAPFPVSTNDENSDFSTADPGFAVKINDVSKEHQTELFSIETSFLSQALAIITAWVEPDGTAYARVRSDKLDLDDTEKSEQKFLLTGDVKLESRYFIYEPKTLSGMTASLASKIGRQFGGVRIYRNGFRVQPYGEPSDDWLNLAYDTGRRYLIVPANNLNFFGQVSIPPSENSLFEETSSREGLIENEAFGELRSFARWAVEWAALRIASLRKRKTSAGETNFSSVVRKPSELLQSFRQSQTSKDSDSGSGSNFEEEFAKVEEAVVEYERLVEEERAAAIEYEEMLRVLASLGLSISVFGHEVRGAQNALAANIMVIGSKVTSILDAKLRSSIGAQHAELSEAADRLFNIGGYIAGLMSRTESRELRELSVKGSIDRFVQQFEDYMAKQNVQFTVDVHPAWLRTTPMHSAELDSVLLNFLTNSIKSMKNARVPSRQVRIAARLENKRVEISFEDNGSGIPKANWERVFHPFYTTTPSADEDGVAGPGTGLGLKIVSDIAESYGGTARVAEASPGYTCKMVFTVLSAK